MQAIQIMSALAQETRLSVFQLLVEALPDGRTASDIADAVGLSRNAMSSHFAILSAADLITAERSGRNVIYSAKTKAVEQLADFLSRAVARGSGGGSSLDW